jgi:hypothetical protein
VSIDVGVYNTSGYEFSNPCDYLIGERSVWIDGPNKKIIACICALLLYIDNYWRERLQNFNMPINSRYISIYMKLDWADLFRLSKSKTPSDTLLAPNIISVPTPSGPS